MKTKDPREAQEDFDINVFPLVFPRVYYFDHRFSIQYNFDKYDSIPGISGATLPFGRLMADGN